MDGDLQAGGQARRFARPDMNVEPMETRAADRSPVYVWILAALCIAGWSLTAIWPKLLAAIGILDFGTPYLDSYAILAALDAARVGADPHLTNPLDPLLRGHVYSDWWLGLHYLGLTRADNFAVAMTWIGGFGVSAWLTSRPRNWGETTWLALILISPPVLLAVKRANNDLVIFTLLAGCGLAAYAGRWWRQIVALGCLGLAAGLKYFPATAALAFLWARPVKKMPAVLLGALVTVAVAMALVAAQIDRGRFLVASGVYTMGAPLGWRDFGWQDAQCAIPSMAVIVAGAILLTIGRVTTGLAGQDAVPERFRAALGAIIILTCFVAGVSYAYRWIFVLWPAIWLWRQARAETVRGRQRIAAVTACVLLPLSLWLDGAFCLFGNYFLRGMSPADSEHLFIVWRRWTQPMHWIFMILLAGWLLDAALVIFREWWASRHES